MCKFIRKSNERILCKLSKSEILRLYSIVYVAMETTKTSHFTRQSKFFISIFFTCQVSACELQPSSCHDLANDIYSSQTAKTVFSHLNRRLSASAIRLSKWTKFLQFDNNRTGGEKKQNLSLHPLGLCRELGKGCAHFPVHGGYLHYLRPNCLRRVLPVLPILASSCFLFASCNRL